MQYCKAKAEQERQQHIYRLYMSDAIMALLEDVTQAFGGKQMTQRYYDIINPRETQEEDAEEIIERIGNDLQKIGEQ